MLSQYDRVYLVATKITPGESGAAIDAAQELIRPERVRVEQMLLDMECRYGGRAFSYVGECLYCGGAPCERICGRRCLHPDKVRPSLEAFGFDISKTLLELFGIRLLWGHDGRLPEYLVLVMALFHNCPPGAFSGLRVSTD